MNASEGWTRDNKRSQEQKSRCVSPSARTKTSHSVAGLVWYTYICAVFFLVGLLRDFVGGPQ